MSRSRAANTLVTLGLLDAEDARRVVDAEASTWADVLEEMGLEGERLDEALAVVQAASGALADDAVTPEVDDRYVEVESLGRGGMGRVVRITDGHLHREVARKELLLNHPAIELRFLREARITAQLEHPGIVPVYELGRAADGTLYYTMKEVRGRTLRQALDDAPSLTDRLKLLGVFVDLCQAVGYAHSKGVVHRDLKPENVMIGAFGETTVLDWGLAKIAGEPEAVVPAGLAIGSGASSDLTRAGTVMGTPKYMSPEQAGGSLDIDARSDVWSIGIMLYELLAGEVPFDGPADSILRQVQDGIYAPVEEIVGGVPPALAAICSKAMSFLPAERYDTAAEVADELEAWRNGATVGAHTYSAMEQVRRSALRFRTVLVGLAGLVLGAATVQRITASEKAALRAEMEVERGRIAFLEELSQGHEALAAGRPGEALARFRHARARPGLRDADRDLAEEAVAGVREAGNVRVLTEQPVLDFRWSPSGRMLAWAHDTAVGLVDPLSGADLGTVKAPGDVATIDFDDEESSIWIGTVDGVVVRVSFQDRTEMLRFETGAPVSVLDAAPAGDRVLAGSPGRLGLWDSQGQPVPLDADLSAARAARWDGSSIHYSEPDVPTHDRWRGREVTTTGSALYVGGELRFRMPRAGTIRRIAVDPGGSQVAAGGEAGLAVWALGPTDEVQSNLRVCPDGRVVPVLPFPPVDDVTAPRRACPAAP